MKYLILAAWMTAWTANASAASFSCKELQEAIRTQALEKFEFYTRQPDISEAQERLLKKAILVAGAMNEKELENISFKQLQKIYDPILRVIFIPSGEYQAVNLSFGDNPYVYLFDFDTFEYSGVSSLDGSTYIDGEFCDVKADILN